MDKKFCAVFAAAFSITALADYAPGWEYSGIVSVNYNQTAVSGNWQGSERDSKNWMIKSDLKAEKDREKKNLVNTIRTEYGESSVSGEPPQISADLIDMESVYTRKFNLYLNPYAAVSVISRFDEFFNPSVLRQSAGLAWNIIKLQKQTLNTRLGAALRQKIEKGASPECETGAESVTKYELEISGETGFRSELRVFTPFEDSIDMRWDSGFYVKLREYLTVRAGYLALYTPRATSFPDEVQTRFTLGLGFSFNLL